MSTSAERPGQSGSLSAPGLPPDADRLSGAARYCANCDALLHGEYCSQCGQRSTEIAVSLPALVKDFADEFLSFDSRLFRSILYLFFRPGFLTRQYLIGRRERYVRPLRLYLVSSLVFFFALSLVPRPALRMGEDEDLSLRELIQREMSEDDDAPEQPEDGTVPGEPAGGDAAAPDARGPDTQAVPGDTAPSPFASVPEVRVGRWSISWQERLERLGRMRPQELMEAFASGLERQLPRMMFVLMPVFALILTLLNLRRPWYYAEHFIFTLHFHAFVFALFLLVLVLPSGPWNRWLLLWGAVYLFLAMRGVYQQPLWKTGVKFVLLGSMYSFLMLLAIIAAVLLTLLFV